MKTDTAKEAYQQKATLCEQVQKNMQRHWQVNCDKGISGQLSKKKTTNLFTMNTQTDTFHISN